MNKTSSVFVCQQCGNEFIKWQGKCPFCGEWNSLVETVKIQRNSSKGKRQISNQKNDLVLKKLTDIKLKDIQRIKTNISELDRCLGGGLVLGQVVLIAGEPGIGKSTLLMQLSDNLKDCLYVSGEESLVQVALRAKRLNIKNKGLVFIESTDVDSIIEQISNSNKKYQAIIVDSIQTMSTSDLNGLSGSVGQVKETAFRLLRYAKANNTPLIIVGHVTKEGTVAGPAVLAHIVDTVLWFEGDKKSNLRILRVTKNRFGSTDEVGIFSMESSGLKPEDNFEKLFLEEKNKQIPGSSLTLLMEGSRSILVEIQSLVVQTKMPIPRRVVQGVDPKRVEMLLAVLFRRAGLKLYDMDVFVNVVGGIKAYDPSVDLAICMSIASSYYDKALANNLLLIGEIGLSGEVRKVAFQDKRVADARRLGFNKLITFKEVESLYKAVKSLLK